MIQTFTAFVGSRRLISGTPAEVALAVKRAGQPTAPVVIFDDATGRSSRGAFYWPRTALIING